MTYIWELTQVFLDWLQSKTMCDQHIRVIQFVEKLPNEYQTTVCTEYKKRQLQQVSLAYQSTQDDLFRSWRRKAMKPIGWKACIWNHPRKKSEVINQNQKAMAKLSFSSPTPRSFICLHLASTEFLTTAKGSCRTSRESYEPKMRWKIPLTRWKLFPHDSIIPFFSLKASYVPGTCLFSILGVEYSKRRSFRVQS